MDLEKVKEKGYSISTILILWDIKNKNVSQATIDLAAEIVEYEEDVPFSIKAIAGSSGKHLTSLAEYCEDIAKREFPEFFPEEDDKDRIDLDIDLTTE
jgi:hypothetical protein